MSEDELLKLLFLNLYYCVNFNSQLLGYRAAEVSNTNDVRTSVEPLSQPQSPKKRNAAMDGPDVRARFALTSVLNENSPGSSAC